LINKIFPSAAAAVTDVNDGATVMIGGFGTAGMPSELIDALIAQDARDLTIVNNNAGNGETGLAALLKARRVRKMAGGTMRQAGILAAAAMHALDHHIDRLADDHVRARRLADGLQGLPGVNVQSPQTNMVFIELPRERAAGAVAALREQGVLSTGLYQLRLVTHLDVNDQDIDTAIAVLRQALQ